jgi:immunity protein 10 of polymorphic toxin system
VTDLHGQPCWPTRMERHVAEKDLLQWAPPVLHDAGEDDGDVYVVGVRETADAESWTLLFIECDDSEEDQEITLGMDTYCLVTSPGQATYYGGVRECEMSAPELRFALTDDAAATLAMPAETRFVLDLSPRQHELLRRGLLRVLTSGRADAHPQILRL